MKYYTFFCGAPGSRKDQWLKVDLKQPALNVRQAITMYEFMMQYNYRNQKSSIIREFQYLEPTRELVHLRYRLIEEYERVFYKNHRPSRHTFRKVKEYPVHRVTGLFDKIEQASRGRQTKSK